MKSFFKSTKFITISILPIMWLIYFFFELFSGRINTTYDFILNLSLIFIFGIIGLIIYNLSVKHTNGFPLKLLFTLSILLISLDQIIKLIIEFNFFNCFLEIIPDFLFFSPIINSNGSWLNARFSLNFSFTFLITLNIIFLVLIFELIKYIKHLNKNNFWSDLCFSFLFAGAFCSLVDKIFYGGSLDFIGISNLFIADIKDIYINLGILFLIMFLYIGNYFKDDDKTLKDDLLEIKNFFNFIKNQYINKKKKR